MKESVPWIVSESSVLCNVKNACCDPKNLYIKKPPGHVGVKRSCFKCCHGWVLGDSSESKSLLHLLQMSAFFPLNMAPMCFI